jgi:hypothetical protein
MIAALTVTAAGAVQDANDQALALLGVTRPREVRYATASVESSLPNSGNSARFANSRNPA